MVQSVLLYKSHFPNVDEAIKWASEKGYMVSKMWASKKFFHFPQREPQAPGTLIFRFRHHKHGLYLITRKA